MLAALLMLWLGATAPDCNAKLTAYGRELRPEERVRRMELPLPSGGQLMYWGGNHAHDPADSWLLRMRQAFEASSPAVVLYEGRSSPPRGDLDDAIRADAEDGMIRWLAQQRQIPTASLEPDPLDERRAVLKVFPVDQALLFYVVRQAMLVREQKGYAQSAIDADALQSLRREGRLFASLGVATPFTDLEGLEAAAHKYWPDLDWRAAPAAWFNARGTSRARGSVFTNDIGILVTRLRDEHMIRVITEAASKGGTVFAAAGMDHLGTQREALSCALGLPAASPTLGR